MKELRMVNGAGDTLDKALGNFVNNLGDCTKYGYYPIGSPTIVKIDNEVFITCFAIKEKV